MMTGGPSLVLPALVMGLACGVDAVHDGTLLSFEIREGYYVDAPPPPQIVLMVSTQTIYKCMNYQLEHQFSASDDILHVTVFDRVTVPEVCLTALGPAQFRVALPVTLGTYTLEFTRDQVTDQYSVTITDSAIEITTLEAQFTYPTAQQFPRTH